MYVAIAPAAVARRQEIIGIFDLDNVTWSHRTRKSLAVCEKQGGLQALGEDLPRTLVVCAPRRSISEKRRCRARGSPGGMDYLTSLSVGTLRRRVESGQI